MTPEDRSRMAVDPARIATVSFASGIHCAAAVVPLRRLTLGLTTLLLIGPGAASAGEPPAADDPKVVAFFEAKIRPVLVEHCYKCHSAKSGKSEGSLLLDSRKSIRAGGDRG